MSNAPSPSNEIEPSVARDSVVTSGCTSFEISNQTSTAEGVSLTSVTRPTCTPATRTGDPP